MSKLLFLVLLFLLFSLWSSAESRAAPTKGKRPKTSKLAATLTLNGFARGEDGGQASECDGKFHNDKTPIVALSTPWYNKGKLCKHKITVFGNGKSIDATVVDECDVRRGCKRDIVDASKAVWDALGVSPKDKRYGLMKVTWSAH